MVATRASRPGAREAALMDACRRRKGGSVYSTSLIMLVARPECVRYPEKKACPSRGVCGVRVMIFERSLQYARPGSCDQQPIPVGAA